MSVDVQWRADITRQMEASSKAQQDTALALERILGRLDTVEKWQESAERQRERAEERADERRDQRDEKRSDVWRANLAIVLSSMSTLLYLLWMVSQHWK